MKYCIDTEHTAYIWLINWLSFSNIFTNWASIGDRYEYLDEFLKNLQNSQAKPKSQRTPHLIFGTGKKKNICDIYDPTWYLLQEKKHFDIYGVLKGIENTH